MMPLSCLRKNNKVQFLLRGGLSFRAELIATSTCSTAFAGPFWSLEHTGNRPPVDLAWINFKNHRKNGMLDMDAKRLQNRLPDCPRCSGQDIWRNGQSRAGKQQWRCKSCGRIFVVDPYIRKDIKLIADRMIIAGISVPQIAEILIGFVSRRWLYNRKGEING